MTRADDLWLAKCEADLNAAMADKACCILRQQLAEAEQRRERALEARRFLDAAWRDATSACDAREHAA